ncbi:MAG: response regulator transcription factor [Burkholderiaceae bacterium]|jgi:DNA-binding NarL/FixJ family response regulator
MRILLIEDHPLFARAIRDEIIRLTPQSSVLIAGCAQDALDALRKQEFELVLADLAIPGASGLSLLKQIRAQTTTRVAIISASDDPVMVHAVFAERAVGFISKATPPETFSQALYLILAGASHFPEYVYAKVAPTPGAIQLTNREITVMRLIAAGKQNKEIARELALGIPTVKSHIKHIYAKLGVKTRVAASIKAGQCGILPSPVNYS